MSDERFGAYRVVETLGSGAISSIHKAIQEPLGLARTLVGILTLIVFVLCFLPFPITIT